MAMATLAFDTHKAVKTLTEAGAAEPLAEAMVATIGVAMGENIATKADVADLGKELRQEMADLRRGVEDLRREMTDLRRDMTDLGEELRQEMAGLGEELRREMADLGKDLRKDMQVLEKKLEASILRMTIALGVLVITVLGGLYTLSRML